MKRLLVLIIIIFLTSTVSSIRAENNRAIYVKLTDVSSSQIRELNLLKIDISNVKNRTEVYAYVTRKQYNLLIEKGYRIEEIPDRSKIYADSLWFATQQSQNPLDAYHTYDELTTELRNLALQYPEICLLVSIGKSVLGRDLWMMKISDNVTVEEYEPEFKYISTMHGNEPLGMELCLYLIHHLLENYNIDSRVTNLVDETEIWIMPLMNPDGYVSRQRQNANGYDLNRNFPDRISDPVNTTDGREPETQAVMNFSNSHSFVLSANFHTGALVVNYPYDSNQLGNYVYTACPDDALFIKLSRTYSRHNPRMWNSAYFPDGITNGALWYVIYGGMQDWNYVWMGCNEVTIELSDNKFPDVSLLPSLWDDNRESMLSYMEAIHWGVRGIVSDAYTGQPLAASIEVVGIDHTVFSDPDLGDYYRMLLPGEYALRFSAEGYITRELTNIPVQKDHITYLDVQLIPNSGLTITGTIENLITGDPIPARLEFDGNFQLSTLADSTSGSFQISVPADSYQVRISNDRFVTVIDTLVVTENMSLSYQLRPYTYVLDLSFEQDDGDLIPGDSLWQWGEPQYGAGKSYAGLKVWATNLTGSYPNNADAKLVLPAVVLPDVAGLLFSFWHWMEAEIDSLAPSLAYDGGIVEISSDNGASWRQIMPWDGYSHTISEFIESGPFSAGTLVFSGKHGWQEQNFDLTAYRGKTAKFRFRFGTDADNDQPYAGWYIDNVAVRYPTVVSGIAGPKNALPDYFSLSPNYPNPFNSGTKFTFTLPENQHVSISIYNLTGQLVRVLVDSEFLPGRYQISWDGTDLNELPVASGLYIIRLKSGNHLLTRKALLLR